MEEHVMYVSYNSPDYAALQAMFSSNPDWLVIPEKEQRVFRPQAAGNFFRIRSKDFKKHGIRIAYLTLALNAVSEGIDFFKAYSVEQPGVQNSVDVKSGNTTVIINNVIILEQAPVDTVKALLEIEKRKVNQ